MKQILMLAVVMLFFAVQVKAQDTTKLVTVKDTSFVQDERLNYMVGTILPAAANFVREYNSKKAVAGDSITKEKETDKFLEKLSGVINDYQLLFSEVTTKQVSLDSVVAEANKLQAEITAIEGNEKITYTDAKKRQAEIFVRLRKLQSYYNQIPK